MELENENILREVPLELVLADRGPPNRRNCQHGDSTRSKDTEVGKYVSPGRMVLRREGGWNLRLEGRMGVVECHKEIPSGQ